MFFGSFALDRPIAQPGRPETTLPDTKGIKQQISDWLYDELQGTVLSGPFQGTKLVNETSWSTHIAPMLLGSYEEELHGEFERQIRRLEKLSGEPRISVVGCAEGYYAIGLKRRLPKAHVFIVDKDPEALRICLLTATANEVLVTVNAPLEDYMNADLVVMDVEGSEVSYLNPDRFPHLFSAHMIVEIHDFKTTAQQDCASEAILRRFRGSHHINFVLEGGRNPHKYKPLCHMSSDYRWLAVSEGRPTMMGWYVMEPKGSYVP